MNRAASHAAEGRFLAEWIVCVKVTFFQGMTGVSQADDLTRADQVNSRLTGLRFHPWERLKL